MNQSKAVGLFGKLPAHGDFIYRDLPSNFINTWDAWLQGFVGSSREQIGEQWLEVYLTSPIWRFAFSEGVIDQYTWAGIVLPSVDRVGRYFPFSIATRLPGTTNPLALINQSAWFESVESAALSALDGQLAIDNLVEEINRMRLKYDTSHAPALQQSARVGTVIKLATEEEVPQTVFPQLLDAALKEMLSSYSVWSTLGSQQVYPCTFYTRGLPQMRGIAAMMDGQWEEWGWHEPYKLEVAQPSCEV